MEIKTPGHLYALDQLDSEFVTKLQFVNRGHGVDIPGVTNQEVLRVLIDRVKFLDAELPWEGNKQIIIHLRHALVLHEARHLQRMVEKGIAVEDIQVGLNRHFKLEQK